MDAESNKNNTLNYLWLNNISKAFVHLELPKPPPPSPHASQPFQIQQDIPGNSRVCPTVLSGLWHVHGIQGTCPDYQVSAAFQLYAYPRDVHTLENYGSARCFYRSGGVSQCRRRDIFTASCHQPITLVGCNMPFVPDSRWRSPLLSGGTRRGEFNFLNF